MYKAVVAGKLNLICTVFTSRFEIEMGFSREVNWDGELEIEELTPLLQNIYSSYVFATLIKASMFT